MRRENLAREPALSEGGFMLIFATIAIVSLIALDVMDLSGRRARRA